MLQLYTTTTKKNDDAGNQQQEQQQEEDFVYQCPTCMGTGQKQTLPLEGWGLPLFFSRHQQCHEKFTKQVGIVHLELPWTYACPYS
jgi:hypothetical protein